MSEKKLLVVHTSDVHLARVGALATVGKDENDRPVQRFIPESEARRQAAQGAVMILKDNHGQEITEETKAATAVEETKA